MVRAYHLRQLAPPRSPQEKRSERRAHRGEVRLDGAVNVLHRLADENAPFSYSTRPAIIVRRTFSFEPL